MRRGALAVAAASLAFARASRAEEPAPVPEPILTETITDVDGHERGELEFEMNAASLRARRGGGYAIDGSVEVEWLVLDKLGVRLEPSIEQNRAETGPATRALSANGGASWKLVRDEAHDFYAQLEGQARVPANGQVGAQPGDPAQPVAVDVRAALRRGFLTVRASVGYGAFGDAEHVPLRTALALLAPFDASGRAGYFGVEADVDGARHAPLVAALNLLPSLAPVGLPLRLGLALPWTVGERSTVASLGVFVRVFYESERENAFARGSRD